MDTQKKVLGCGAGTIGGAVILFVGVVVGFIFLMRACLSQWDSYGIVGWPGITDDQKTMVMVKTYSKTNSYSSKNGVTHISYSTTYYLEKVNLETGKVELKKKLMKASRIKKGGMNCFGGYKNKLWIFADYLRGYDMNTLEMVVKTEDIENKNPELKGKMPVESQYYDAHINLGYIIITAQDGDKYKIMLDDLHAELIDEKADDFDSFAADIEKQQKELEEKYKALTDQTQQNYRDYLDKKITRSEWEKRVNETDDERDTYYDLQDSLRKLEENARDFFQAQQDLLREQEDFDAFSTSTSDWLTLKDTTMGNGYTLSKEDPDDEHFDLSNFNSIGSETDKVKLYKFTLEVNKESRSRYDKYIVKKIEVLGSERFLQGGFLRDYRTAKIFQPKNPGGFIIFSRDIVGDKGKLLVTRVDLNGKKLWQTDAQMSFDVSFAVAVSNYLVICGTGNKEKKASFASADAVRIIDLKTGNLITVKY